MVPLTHATHKTVQSFYWPDYVVQARRQLNIYFYPRWAVERQHHFSDSTNIKDVFQDYVNLVEFLISLEHVPSI